jgi:5-hydroxyisourate hydrolase-like protein (transthyretin family)
MRISLTRVVAVAAIASAALLPLASPASAAAPKPGPVKKAPTTLSIKESSTSVAPGHQDVISGVLLSGKNTLANRTVGLYRYDARAMTWVKVAADRTGKAGRASFTVKPASTADYRLEFQGSKTLAASRSGVARVLVAKLAITLSIAESKVSITAGKRDVISGILLTGKNGLARRTIELYRYDARAMTWVKVAAKRTGKGGKVDFVVTPVATARYELVFYGSPTLRASRSGTATVTVTR